MAKKADKSGASRMDFMVQYMKANPSAVYADVAAAAKAKGHEIFPIMYGRVQKLLGLVGSGGPAKKKPGRPPKAAAAASAAAPAAAPKRRGRPPGSKNKPKVAPAAAPAAAAAPKRRGRPPGSKNKPKVAPMTAAAPAAPVATTRGGAIALPIGSESDLNAWRSLVGGANAGGKLALQFDGSRWYVLFV